MGKPVNKTLRIAAMSAGEEIGHVSGSIVTFRGNGDPLRSLVANIEPVQSGSGDPSPDNVRPISGWSGMNIFQTGSGVNLIPAGTNGNKGYAKDRYLNADGTTAVGLGYYISEYFPVKAGENYTWNSIRPVQMNLTSICFYDINKAYLSGETSYTVLPKTITAPLGAAYCRVSVIRDSAVEISAQVQHGSTATTPFAPFSTSEPATIPITWQSAGTVYGGTLDVTGGVLTVTHILFTSNTATMNNSEDYPGWQDAGVRSYGFPTERYSNIIGSVGNICSINTNGTSNDILYLNKTYYGKTQAEWISLAIDVQFVLPLPTPIIIPLTATQISTLQGENNLWADSGDVDVEYIATGGEGGKLALLLRNRKELLIALRKGLSPAEVGLLGSIPSFGGFVRPGLSTDDEKEEDELI